MDLYPELSAPVHFGCYILNVMVAKTGGTGLGTELASRHVRIWAERFKSDHGIDYSVKARARQLSHWLGKNKVKPETSPNNGPEPINPTLGRKMVTISIFDISLINVMLSLSRSARKTVPSCSWSCRAI